MLQTSRIQLASRILSVAGLSLISLIVEAQTSPSTAAVAPVSKPDAVRLVQQYVQENKARKYSAPGPAGIQRLLPAPTAPVVAAKPATSSNATPVGAQNVAGPAIMRVKTALYDRPTFEKVVHPAPAAGEKIVVVPLQRTKEGVFELDKFQVTLKFTVNRLGDTCNHVTIQGDVAELPVPGRTYLHALRLSLRKESTQITYKACDDPRRETRAIEVTTQLAAGLAFRDNVVLYVPEDVTVTAQIWQAVRIVPAVTPDALPNDFTPSELAN